MLVFGFFFIESRFIWTKLTWTLMQSWTSGERSCILLGQVASWTNILIVRIIKRWIRFFKVGPDTSLISFLLFAIWFSSPKCFLSKARSGNRRCILQSNFSNIFEFISSWPNSMSVSFAKRIRSYRFLGCKFWRSFLGNCVGSFRTVGSRTNLLAFVGKSLNFGH